MLTTFCTCKSKLRRLISVIINNFTQILCCKYNTAFCFGTLVLSAQVKTICGRESHTANSLAGGAPASFVTGAGSCLCSEAEVFKKTKDNTAEWLT